MQWRNNGKTGIICVLTNVLTYLLVFDPLDVIQSLITLYVCRAKFSLKMRGLCSSETSSFLRTVWRYNPEDRTLNNNRCENVIQTLLCSGLG
jgi:hypothetical protein